MWICTVTTTLKTVTPEVLNNAKCQEKMAYNFQKKRQNYLEGTLVQEKKKKKLLEREHSAGCLKSGSFRENQRRRMTYLQGLHCIIKVRRESFRSFQVKKKKHNGQALKRGIPSAATGTQKKS